MRIPLSPLLPALALAGLAACGQESGSVPEVPAQELSAEVPELAGIHEYMHPLWHDAVPERDFQLLRELLPDLGESVSALDTAELPGILRDKETAWEEGKAQLLESFRGLEEAAAEGDEEGMLGYAETFHMSYEGLARLVRPPLPEMDAVHQHLYALYHHYGPGYDLEKIRGSTLGMQETIPPLLEAELPSRLEGTEDEFRARVLTLQDRVGELLAALEDPVREEVQAAVDSVHTAYAQVDALFVQG